MPFVINETLGEGIGIMGIDIYESVLDSEPLPDSDADRRTLLASDTIS